MSEEVLEPAEETELDSLVPAPRARVRGTGDLSRADNFSIYLSEIRRYPLLTREEEHKFASDFYERGDKDAGRRLVTGNLRLVVKIALEYRRAWAQVMDLVQEGNIGLAEAVKRFDPFRGVRFSSFARYWIRALILQFILKNFRLVSFANTRAGRKLFFRLEKERRRLIQEVGEATPKLLAESLEVSEAEIAAAETFQRPVLSLSAPRGTGDDQRTLSDVVASNETGIEGQVGRAELMANVDAQLHAFYDGLTDERERVIWTERLLAEEPAALADLGERFGVSRERIRQIEARLKERLKAFLVSELGSDLSLDFNAQD